MSHRYNNPPGYSAIGYHAFINALRAVLGLGPIPFTTCEWRKR